MGVNQYGEHSSLIPDKPAILVYDNEVFSTGRVSFSSSEPFYQAKAVDYSQYFVLTVQQGPTESPENFVIKQLMQEGDRIYIVANPPPTPVNVLQRWKYYYPYHMVRVSKQNMIQPGELEFILMDEDGQVQNSLKGPVSPYISLPARHYLHYDVLGAGESTLESSDAQIRVVTNGTEYTPWVYDIKQAETADGKPISGIDPIEAESEIKALDSQKEFVLILYQGWRGYSYLGIYIMGMWQDADVIYVQAYFVEPGKTVAPLSSAPLQVIKVDKMDMTQFGDITFVLLDKEGEEKARTVATIPKS